MQGLCIGGEGMTRAERLRVMRSLLNETRKQEYAEWEAAETGISELPSAENRRRAVALRIKGNEIISRARAAGFTEAELA